MPDDWFDWDWGGGEGGESGGGGEGGSDFWSGDWTSSPVVGWAFVIALIGGGASQCGSSGVSRLPNLPDPPELPSLSQPAQPATPPPAEVPRGAPPPWERERQPRLFGNPYCGNLIADAQFRYGPRWENGISYEDRLGCGPQIELERQRSAIETRRTSPPAAFVDIAPQLIERAQPKYPPRALERGREGLVRVEFTVAADGSVTDAVVIWSEPPGVFDSAALDAVRRWRYQPRRIDGRPAVSGRMQAEIAFNLTR